MKSIKSAFFAVLLATLTFALPALANSNWKVVPNKEVCMVTNMHFAKPQIPVEQGGKTYYGCCQNCKATIQTDASSRSAVDPYSKKSVDKAKATVASNNEGSVLYFENRTNFEKYMAGQKGK